MMSNTELYYEQLTDLSVRIAVGIKNRTAPLGNLAKAMTQLSQTNAIKGNSANAMKAYISEVHMTLIQTLQLLLNNYEMALGKYVKGYLEVDSSESFKLVKEDFDDHKRKLSSHRSDFTSIGNQLKAISDEAEDIISLAGAGSNRLFNVAKEMDAMKKTVSDLNDRWNSYEQTDPGFNQVQNLIAQTKSLLKSTLSVPRAYSYSPGSFSKLMSKNFVDAFIANANYAQNPDNQKAFKDDWNSISKNYTADQKRMAEEAKKKAQEEGLIGLIWDGVQICAGTVLVATGAGAGFGIALIAGGVNSAINHASMATTGKSFNIVGNLTNGAVQWYNKNIGNPLVKTGNPIAKFVAGLGNGAIQVAGGMGQFSVYDMGKTVHTLVANPQARSQFFAGVGSWWNQVRSGNAYVIGQTTATVASLFVGGKDIGVAVGKASEADSLLSRISTFSKDIVVSSAKNVKNIISLPGKVINDIKDTAGFVNEKLIPATQNAVKNFKNLAKDTAEDLKGLNPQGEFVTPDGLGFKIGNDIKLSDVGNNFKNGVRDIRDNFVKAVKSEDERVSNHEVSFDDINKSNLEANPFDENGELKPDIKYKTGEFDYLYETDDMGRISKFETDNLQLTDRANRLPHNPDTPGKLDGDHAGHLAGDRFGGSPELDNLVSQSSNVNLSKYKKIENQWATEIKKGKNVKVNVEVKYDGDSLRPSEFNVKYEIDGKRYRQSILN